MSPFRSGIRCLSVVILPHAESCAITLHENVFYTIRMKKAIVGSPKLSHGFHHDSLLEEDGLVILRQKEPVGDPVIRHLGHKNVAAALDGFL